MSYREPAPRPPYEDPRALHYKRVGEAHVRARDFHAAEAERFATYVAQIEREVALRARMGAGQLAPASVAEQTRCIAPYQMPPNVFCDCETCRLARKDGSVADQ